MIITCRKCETKYRFDDALMAGDGVWVRCSLCKEVFFQDSPAVEGKPAVQPARGEAPQPLDGGKEEEQEPSLPAGSDVAGGEAGKAARVSSVTGGEGLDITIREFGDVKQAAEAGEDISLEEEAPEEAAAEEEEKRSVIGRFFAYLFVSILVILSIGAGYLWIFPQDREEAIEYLTTYFPELEPYLKAAGQPQSFLRQIELQNVEQHFVNNLLMGNLRIVQGTAVNTSNFTLARLEVKARLYDDTGIVIGEGVAYCGNLLTEAELATLTEGEIQQKLLQPLGSSFPNDRLKPGGQVPFMIVIAHQQAAARTTVIVSNAERRLD